MGSVITKKAARLKRKKRVRKKIFGTEKRPRLNVFRSAKHIYAQIVVDTRGETLASASTVDDELKSHPKFESKAEQATYVGKLIAERSVAKGISKVVFDRNGFLYHGRVKALSDGAREAGLIF
jgi:large subunit ribosomal protein L18